jgi:putative copper export protein
MDFLALLLAVGATAFVHLVARPVAAEGRHAAVADAVTARAARVALVAGLAMLPALAGRLGVQSALLHGAADTWNADRVATLVGGTQWGTGWLLQAGAACVFLAAAVLAARPATRAAGWALAVPAAAALCAVPALSGHAAAAERLRGLAIAADTLHVAGAGTWLGALAVLLATLPVALRGADGHDAVAALVNRFSPVALGAAALAGATGVGNALFHLSSPGELTGTTYGRTLLLKVGLLAVVAGLGFFNWRRVRPALGTPEAAARLRRSALAEVVVGILVVAVTATLVALPTP